MAQISVTVNGKTRAANVEPRMLLVHFLREQLNLTGTHVGCDTSQCGACTVLLDGRSAKSCTMFAVPAISTSSMRFSTPRTRGEHARVPCVAKAGR